MRHSPGLPRNQSLERAVEILRALAGRFDGASASELARATDLPRPTAGRLLATLADAGLVERLPGSEAWILGPEIIRLGRAADSYRRFVVRAQPLLEELAEKTGESAVAGVCGPDFVEVLACADSPRLVGVMDWAGRRVVALHASAGGKVYLASLSEEELDAWLSSHALTKLTERTITDADALRAELARVRKRGYSLTVDELEEGLTSIGLSLTGPGEPTMVGLGVTGPTFRLGAARCRAIVPVMRRVADRLRIMLP